VQYRDARGQWRTEILPGRQRALDLTTTSGARPPTVVWVSAVDRLGNASRLQRVVVAIPVGKEPG